MDYTPFILYSSIIIVILIFVLYILNIMKKRNVRIEEHIEDDAYNSMEMARSIAVILERKGYSTGDAYEKIEQAERLYREGKYAESIEKSREAKEILHKSMNEKRDESNYMERKKINFPDENYLPAKFTLGKVHDLYEKSGNESYKIKASMFIKSAEISFKNGDYRNSLKDSLRAEKILNGIDVNVLKCPNCNADVHENDVYCPNCGFLLKNKCPKCGAEIKQGDKFCRNCGFELMVKI